MGLLLNELYELGKKLVPAGFLPGGDREAGEDPQERLVEEVHDSRDDERWAGEGEKPAEEGADAGEIEDRQRDRIVALADELFDGADAGSSGSDWYESEMLGKPLHELSRGEAARVIGWLEEVERAARRS